jgi:hypothetical protein
VRAQVVVLHRLIIGWSHMPCFLFPSLYATSKSGTGELFVPYSRTRAQTEQNSSGVVVLYLCCAVIADHVSSLAVRKDKRDIMRP